LADDRLEIGQTLSYADFQRHLFFDRYREHFPAWRIGMIVASQKIVLT
jgi:hypothetical protein